MGISIVKAAGLVKVFDLFLPTKNCIGYTIMQRR